MGVDLASASHLTRLMSSEDAARYGIVTGTGDTQNANKSSRKRPADERREQAEEECVSHLGISIARSRIVRLTGP